MPASMRSNKPRSNSQRQKINEIESQYQKLINYQKRSTFSTKLRKPRNRVLTNTEKLAPSTRTRLKTQNSSLRYQITYTLRQKKINFFTKLIKPSNHSHTNKKNKTEKYRNSSIFGVKFAAYNVRKPWF